MTANELIKIFERINQDHTTIGWETIQFVAPLLRQQAKEIEALNNAVDSLVLNNVLWELTDEEIVSCIDESEPNATDMIRFARAILKKASEK